MALEAQQLEDPNRPENLDNEEDQDKPGDQKEKSLKDKIFKSKLTPKEVKSVKEKKTSFPKLAQERNRLAKMAEAELKNLTIATKDKDNVIDIKEYRNLKKELDETQSPQKMQELLEKIQDLPRQKEEQKAKEEEEEEKKPLSPDHPKLKEFKKQFDDICEKNKHLIGEDQLDEFREWAEEQITKTPTIKNAKELIKRLQGKDPQYQDKNGLHPRRIEYQNLTRLFTKYGFKSPLDSEFIKREGLSERIEFRKNAEDLEKHLDNVKDTGFYSKEAIQKIMKECLTSENCSEQSKLTIKAKNISRKESESFTYLNAKMQVGGITIRKMSEASKSKYLEYYKNTEFKEREGLVNQWKDLVENEANLTKELEEIYKDDPETLKKAVQGFQNLDFLAKQKSLEEHKKLVETSQDKEELNKKLTIKAAESAIDEAGRTNIIADSTKEKYKEWFNNEEKFKNAKTGKTGDLEALEKAYETLVSKTPDADAKNLIAYEIKRNRFVKEVEELKRINSDVDENELKKWQEDYDCEGWTNRKKVYKDIKKEQEKQKEEQKKKKKIEKKAGIEDEDKKGKDKNKEKVSPKLSETIKSVTELLDSDQAAEAMKILLAYNEMDPDNEKILFWIKTTAEYMEKFGSGKKLEETMEEQIEEDMEEAIESSETLQDELEEQQIKTLNIEGARQSEERHHDIKDAAERAEKESLERVEAGSLEEDLTKDFYEQTDGEYVVDKDKTGEEVEEIDIDNLKMYDEERVHQKTETYKKQIKLSKKEGFADVIFKARAGRTLTTDEAETEQKQELEGVQDELAERTLEKTEAKIGTNKEFGAKVFDLNAKIAANRKAKEIIDRKRHEKLKNAA